MSRFTPLLAALFIASLTLASHLGAQSAPAGSCLLPTGDWCWPIAPLTFGEPCECQLPDGSFVDGVVQ